MVGLRQARPVLVALGLRRDVSPTPFLFVIICGTVNSLIAAQKISELGYDKTSVERSPARL